MRDEGAERERLTLSRTRAISLLRREHRRRAADFGPSAYVGSTCPAATSDSVYLYCTRSVSDEVFRCIFRLFQACLGSCLICPARGSRHSLAALKADIQPWDSEGERPLVMYDPNPLAKIQTGTAFASLAAGDLRRVGAAISSAAIAARVLGDDWRSLHDGMVARVWPNDVGLFISTFHCRKALDDGMTGPLAPYPAGDDRIGRTEPMSDREEAAVSELQHILGSQYRLDEPLPETALLVVWVASDMTPGYVPRGSDTTVPYLVPTPQLPAEVYADTLNPPKSGEGATRVTTTIVCVCARDPGGGLAPFLAAGPRLRRRGRPRVRLAPCHTRASDRLLQSRGTVPLRAASPALAPLPARADSVGGLILPMPRRLVSSNFNSALCYPWLGSESYGVSCTFKTGPVQTDKGARAENARQTCLSEQSWRALGASFRGRAVSGQCYMSQPAHTKVKTVAISKAVAKKGIRLWQQSIIYGNDVAGGDVVAAEASAAYAAGAGLVHSRVRTWGVGNNLRVEIGLPLAYDPSLDAGAGRTLGSLASEAAIEASLRLRSLDLEGLHCVPWNDVRCLLDAFYTELGQEAEAALRARPATLRLADVVELWKPLALWSYIEGGMPIPDLIQLRGWCGDTIKAMRRGGLPFLDHRLLPALRGRAAREAPDPALTQFTAIMEALGTGLRTIRQRRGLITQAAKTLAPLVRRLGLKRGRGGGGGEKAVVL